MAKALDLASKTKAKDLTSKDWTSNATDTMFEVKVKDMTSCPRRNVLKAKAMASRTLSLENARENIDMDAKLNVNRVRYTTRQKLLRKNHGMTYEEIAQ